MVISAAREAEARGLQVEAQPGNNENLPQNKIKRARGISQW